MTLFRHVGSRWLLVVISMTALLACHQDTDEFSPVSRLELKLATPYLNNDGRSQLALTWTLYDQAGQQVLALSTLQQVQVYADGIPLPNPRQYATDQPGVHSLRARLGTLTSLPLSVTARAGQTYPLVRMPVVLHLAKRFNAQFTTQQVQALLEEVNALYRNQRASSDPNKADSFIEFYAALNAPNGRALAQPGLNQLDFDSPLTDEASAAKVDSVLYHWCIKQYVNVFVGIDWEKKLYAGKYNYSYYPDFTTGTYPGDPACGTNFGVRAAICILDKSSLVSSTIAHEFGHMLGLRHTFAECWRGAPDARVQDTPRQEEAHPTADNTKVTCDQVSFVATNVMDYYNQRFGFTRDQVTVMRTTVSHPTYLPLSGNASSGRLNGRSQPLSPLSISRIACKE